MAALSATVERWPSADLAYAVLAHVPLGRDAASLWRGSARPWSQPLADALRADAAGLSLQFVGLRHTTLAGLDAAAATLGGALGRAYRRALDDLRPRVCVPHAPAPAWAERARLDALRRVLYGGPPPPLRLVHVPWLGDAGRALTHGGERRVAVDVTRPEALLQAFHEECHAVTDPLTATGAARTTHADTPGFAEHVALERAAVAYGQVVLEDAAPDLLPRYAAWRARFGGVTDTR